MKRINNWRIIMAAVALGALLTGGAQASVSLQNGSFESQPIPSGSIYYDAVHSYMPDNWLGYNGAGANAIYTYNRNASQWTSDYGTSLRYGDQVLGLGRGQISSVWQYLGDVSTGESYTLTGMVGNPNDTTGNPGQFSVHLALGNSATVHYYYSDDIAVIDQTTVGDPARGTWNSFSLTSPTITAADSGDHLYVLLRSEGTGGWPNYREFENLSLAVTMIPEPSAVALSVLGGCGLWLLGRKRR